MQNRHRHLTSTEGSTLSPAVVSDSRRHNILRDKAQKQIIALYKVRLVIPFLRRCLQFSLKIANGTEGLAVSASLRLPYMASTQTLLFWDALIFNSLQYFQPFQLREICCSVKANKPIAKDIDTLLATIRPFYSRGEGSQRI